MAHLNDSLTTVVDKLTGFEYYKVDEKANAESIADITAISANTVRPWMNTMLISN